MTEKERMDYLVDRYGIVCKRTVAARILGVSPSTVSYMIRDGRLDDACWAAAEWTERSIAPQDLCCLRNAGS